MSHQGRAPLGRRHPRRARPTLTGVDLSRYLPLSNSPRTNDPTDARSWAAVVATQASTLAAGHPDERDLVAAFSDACRLPLPARLATAADLQQAAEAMPTGPAVRTADLVASVRALFALEEATGAIAVLPDLLWGRIALHGSAHANFARRSVLAGHTVAASDAEWSFGRGPTITAPQRDIVRFVLGVSEIAPRP